MFWSELIPSLLFLILLSFVPKSPRWLALKGDEAGALKILNRINSEEQANEEIKRIKESLKSKANKSKVNYLSKTVLIIIAIRTALSALQQFTGINAVLYYGADISEKALGIGKEEVLAQQILLAFVNLVFTFVAMFTVDKYGRKPLIYVSQRLSTYFIILLLVLDLKL